MLEWAHCFSHHATVSLFSSTSYTGKRKSILLHSDDTTIWGVFSFFPHVLDSFRKLPSELNCFLYYLLLSQVLNSCVGLLLQVGTEYFQISNSFVICSGPH